MMPIRHTYQNWLPNLFDDLFDTDWMRKTNGTAPAINVKEDETQYTVEVAAPGMQKDDFQVHVDEDGNLVIKMEKKEETPNAEKEKNTRYLRREFAYSKFQQMLSLPEDVDKQGISAHVEHGVLTVALPKLKPEQKQQLLQHIEVK